MGSGNMGYPGGPRGGGMAQYQMNRMQQGGYPGINQHQGPYHNARMMPSMNPQMQRHAFVSH